MICLPRLRLLWRQRAKVRTFVTCHHLFARSSTLSSALSIFKFWTCHNFETDLSDIDTSHDLHFTGRYLHRSWANLSELWANCFSGLWARFGQQWPNDVHHCRTTANPLLPHWKRYETTSLRLQKLLAVCLIFVFASLPVDASPVQPRPPHKVTQWFPDIDFAKHKDQVSSCFIHFKGPFPSAFDF